MATREIQAAVILLVAHAALLPAQRRWTEIGPTASGNVVSFDPRSVKRSGNLIAATVRVVFTPPVKTAKGMWYSSRTTATFDCAKKSLAAKENVYYADKAETKIADRKVNKLPGFGPALGGSLGGVSLDYLCARK